MIAVVSVIYLVIALGYPADAGGVPAIIAAIAAAVALFQLAARGIGVLRHRTVPDETVLPQTVRPGAAEPWPSRPGL